jgi:hypothetical protein
MVCPSATSKAEARWLRFGLVVVATTSRRYDKDQGYDHVQAYLGICQKKIYVKKIYVKKIYVKKSRAQFLHFVYFSHVTSTLGFTKLLK